MTKPSLPFWDRAETNNDEPPGAKQNAGNKAGFPEAAQYVNWLFVQIWKWLRGMQGSYADIVVGTVGEVTSKDADNTVADFVAAIVNGDHVHFLPGAAHALTQNEDITEDDVKVTFAPGAILDDGTDRTLTFSGLRAQIGPGIFTGFTIGDIIVSGAGSKITGIDIDEDVIVVSNGAVAEFLSANAAIKPNNIFDANIERSTLINPIINGSIVNSSLPFSNIESYNVLIITDVETIINTGTDEINFTANHTYSDSNQTAVAVKFTQVTTIATTNAPQITGSTILYVKVIDADTIELYRNKDLVTDQVTFTDDGTGDITLTPQFLPPTSVTRVWVEVYGGGGGGERDNSAGATGGGAGGVAEGFLTVTPGTAIAIVVGIGGAGKSSNSAGDAGETSTFSSLSSTGGGGGASNGGDGGIGSGGDMNMNGGSGKGAGTQSGGGGGNKRGGGSRSAQGGSLFGGGGGGATTTSGDGGTGGVVIWF